MFGLAYEGSGIETFPEAPGWLVCNTIPIKNKLSDTNLGKERRKQNSDMFHNHTL